MEYWRLDGERDPLWENVMGYIGPIRNYIPENWTSMRQDEICEIYLELTVENKTYSVRYVADYLEIRHPGTGSILLAIIIDSLVNELDHKLYRVRKKIYGILGE